MQAGRHADGFEAALAGAALVTACARGAAQLDPRDTLHLPHRVPRRDAHLRDRQCGHWALSTGS